MVSAITNQGDSGYEPISWDEAFDIVASEIKRMKSSMDRATYNQMALIIIGGYRLLSRCKNTFHECNWYHRGAS